MWNWAVDEAVDLLMEQYHDMTDHYDVFEVDYLTEEAEKGLEAFSVACDAVFGVKLEQVLCLALSHAYELNEHAHSIVDSFHDDESKEESVLLANDLSEASHILLGILEKRTSEHILHYRELTTKIEEYAKKIKLQLDPDDRLCPQVPKT